MNLEAELFTLQDSNSKLVAALHEANANVEQWKKQLAAYQEETERLREQVNLAFLHPQSTFITSLVMSVTNRLFKKGTFTGDQSSMNLPQCWNMLKSVNPR